MHPLYFSNCNITTRTTISYNFKLKIEKRTLSVISTVYYVRILKNYILFLHGGIGNGELATSQDRVADAPKKGLFRKIRIIFNKNLL